MSELAKKIAEYNKKSKGSIIKLKEIGNQKVVRTSTGSFSLDIATGGGFPAGSIVELYGEESTGKSLLALKTIAQSQQSSEKDSVYVDLEGTMTIEWAKKVGVDPDRLYIARPKTAEEALDLVDGLASTGDVGVIVIDSVAALVPKVEEENDLEKQQMGTTAKLMSKHLRGLVSTLQPSDLSSEGEFNPCTIIYINQTREKIGIVYGNPLTTPGGKALKFFSSIRIQLKKGEIFKNTDKEIEAQEVKFVIQKNKTYKPFQVGMFKFYYEGFIDNEEAIVQYAIVFDLVKQGGAWFTFEEERFQGKAKLVEYLKSKPKVLAKLEKDIAAITKRG
jgi:recombination protein RecA